MTYEIDAKFIIITNNRKLIKNQAKRQDSHYTIKAMLGSIVDLSICGAEKLNQNTITTLLIPREKHDQYKESLKTGKTIRELVVSKKLMSNKEIDSLFG